MKGQFLTALGVLLATLLTPAGCSRKAENANGQVLPRVTVQTQVAENKGRGATEETVGTVRAKLHAVSEAKVSGKIDRMLVVPGQRVPAGELLATVDARTV